MKKHPVTIRGPWGHNLTEIFGGTKATSGKTAGRNRRASKRVGCGSMVVLRLTPAEAKWLKGMAGQYGTGEEFNAVEKSLVRKIYAAANKSANDEAQHNNVIRP